MAGKPISDEQAWATAEAALRLNYNQCAMSREMGISRKTLGTRLKSDKVKAVLAKMQKPFVKPDLPSPDETLDQLRARLRETSGRKIAADDAQTLIPVRIKVPGPVGIFLMGDPHLGNDGCDFAALERDLALVANNPRIMSINIGDVTDNWIGRLEREYAASSFRAADGWRLAEWLFNEPVNWLALVGGNHDTWSGHRDPLKWITKAKVPMYEPSAARIALHHPNGAITRIHARHDFRGQSMYSDLHGHRRQVREGARDHLLVAGHLHSGEDGAIVNGDGFISQMVRLSGYKVVDQYAKDLGFQRKPMHRSALAIIDPNVAETERSRVWLAPSIEHGVQWLAMVSRQAA